MECTGAARHVQLHEPHWHRPPKYSPAYYGDQVRTLVLVCLVSTWWAWPFTRVLIRGPTRVWEVCSDTWAGTHRRSHIAKEMAEDLSAISEENARLMRESLTASLSFPAFSPEEDSPDGSGQPAP